MLHLAIIGIVCAISAPSEDTTFIGQKNNESVFCHFEKEQNVAKVLLPSYNVGVYNTSGCAKQKITNRTSSFFYDYTINQYQNSKNSSCSIIKNALLEKQKKLHSNVEFAFKKRNLLWTQHYSKFSTKTLRPVMAEGYFPFQKLSNDKLHRSKKHKAKIPRKAKKKLRKMHEDYNLNAAEKKMFLRLKKIEQKSEKEKFYPKYLDGIKVVDELDLNRRIEKLVKEAAMENQEKEKCITNDYKFMKSKISDSFQGKKIKESFFDSIKKLFCFHKNSFKNKKRDVHNVINSFPVNNIRSKDSIAQKMALRSNFNISKTKRRVIRFKRSIYSSYDYFSDPIPIHRQNFIDTPYPYSAHSISKKCFLHRPGIQQVFPKSERMRSRPRNSLENWPFLKKLYFDKRNIHDSRLKHFDIYTKKSTPLPTTKEEDGTTVLSFKGTQEINKSIDKITESMNAEKSSTKGIEHGKTTEEIISSSLTLFKNPEENTTINLIDFDKEFMLPDHTLEKPLLKQDLKNEKFEYYKPDPNFEEYESRYDNFMTDFPIFDSNHFQPNLKYKYELPDNKYLRPFRLLKIRRALQNYLVHNNVWSPYNRYFSFERKKRCGGQRCSVPRKCWRSAPLLCVPYIRKSQEDVLKYLIRVMQKMMGKPLPPKRDIFEKTKFKPFLQKEVFSGCENTPEEETYECECETAPTSYPEYLDLCPFPPQPLYCANPKSFFSNANSLSPSCSFTSKFYAASPFPPHFPYHNSDKINPEFVKSFPFANCNSQKLRQCFPIHSLPPDIQFYALHTEQIEKQNPVHHEEKFTKVLPESTSMTPVIATTLATGLTSAANISNSSQIVVSLPVYSNISNSNVTKTSSPISFASDSDVLLPQPAPTTTATLTSTNFEGVCPTPSTKSACSLYVSNSPVEQEEHFSYTAVPYNAEPESATIINQNSKTVSLIPSDQKPNICNPLYSERNACFAKIENTSPNTQQLLEWPYATNFLPTTETFDYQSQIKETPGNYKELYESSQEYPHEYNQFKKDDISQKFDLSKSTKEGLEKSFQYNDNFQLQNSEKPPKMFLGVKHKKIFKSKIKPQSTDFLPLYDYYMYNKYPMSPNENNNNMKFGRYSVPHFFWKDFGRKMKTMNDFKSLIRRKRKDYDFVTDDFDSFNEYLDNSDYSDEDLNSFPGPYAKSFTENYLNSGGTSPHYEMLRELAKVIKEFNTTKSESTTPMIKEKSSTNRDSVLQMVKSTSNKAVDKVKNNNERPLSQSNNKSSTITVNLFKTLASKTISSEVLETDDMNFSNSKISLTTDTIDTKSKIKDRVMDSKKSGKMSFFQTNSKIMQTSKNSKKDSGKEERELGSNKDTKTEKEGLILTTLKTATIVKGQKKSLTKPSSKVYPKVYPDSFSSDVETNDTTFASTVTTVKAYTENRTALLSSTSKPDIRLQLLAVCEGYLEIVKLIKGQNQTTEGDLDADLARYCENIISQSFNNQLEKPKKHEIMEFSSQNVDKEEETADSFTENASKFNSQTGYETAKDFSESQLREKIIAAIQKNSVYTKKNAMKINETNKATLNGNSNSNDDDDENYIDKDEGENDDNNNYNGNYITLKNEEEKSYTEFETAEPTEAMEIGTTTENENNDSLIECLVKMQRKEKAEKGLSKEEIKMLKILIKRKKALLSWLFNSKDQDKLGDLDETEYSDDEVLTPEIETSKNSGTIKPKSGEKKSGRAKKNLIFENESDFPIYAKRYGYDKGGELREVEVLWRKINKKTHEEKIFKNISVLALFMASPNINNEETKLVVNNGHEDEDMISEEVTNKSKMNYAAVNLAEYDEKTTAPAVMDCSRAPQNISNSTQLTNTITKSTESNLTHTYITKPDSSSIVGECSKVKNSHPNTTRKTSSRKMELAKDIFQEYTIEFVNYAVYILPIMLTIIFLFCCLCCALHILKAQQSLKRHRKKKKNQFITHETSDSTENSEFCSKKKKRKVMFKKGPKYLESDTVSDKTGTKKFWSILKLPSNPSNKVKSENCQKSKKNTLLRFLRDNRKKLLESDYPSLGPKEKEGDDESLRTDNRSETADKRELIALLEEVKKIEMEQMDDKNELKSVQVQYMTQEDGSSVLQRPDVFYPHQKNPFGMSKGYSYSSKPYPFQQTNLPTLEDGELYEDVNELTELLPCKSAFFSKKSDCLRHYDFSTNQQNPCKNYLKIFRGSRMCHNGPINEKNFVKNESENRSFIFNKYRSISMDPSEELMGVTRALKKNADTEMRLPSPKNADILKEIDNLKRQLNSKKNVHLKDHGVLCRL